MKTIGIMNTQPREGEGMPVNTLSVNKGARMMANHPKRCAELFLKGVKPLLEDEQWFNRAWCLKFCAAFLENTVDQSVERAIDHHRLARIKALPIKKAFRLLKKDPEKGMNTLIVIISSQLREQQRFNVAEQYEFYNAIFASFFPEFEQHAEQQEHQLAEHFEQRAL